MTTTSSMSDVPSSTEPSQKGPSLAGGFAQRLFEIRKRKDLSQSELARLMWGTMTDGRGYEVARNRDRVSSWEAGRSAPTRANLAVLAETLGVDVAELAPDLVLTTPTMGQTPTKFSLVCLPNNMAHIRVDMTVPFDVATKIGSLLSNQT